MATELGHEKRNLWMFESGSAPPAAFEVVEPRRSWAGGSPRTRAIRLAVSRLGRRWPSPTDIESASNNLGLHALWFYAPHEKHKRARARRRTREYSARDAERFADETGAHAGHWVAVKDRRVLYAGDSPRDVVLYLRERGLKSDSLFRVPMHPEDDQVGDE